MEITIPNYAVALRMIREIFRADQLRRFIEGNDKVFGERSLNYEILKPIDMEGQVITQLAKQPFSGKLYAKDGVVIKNLKINLPEQDNVGFISQTNGAKISNLTFEDLEVNGHNAVGGLIGESTDSILNNIRVTGNVTGTFAVGGSIGAAAGTTLGNVKMQLDNVSGKSNIGGLIGSQCLLGQSKLH